MKLARNIFSVMMGVVILASNVYAHGPTPQRVDEQLVLSADIDDVWQVVADFSSIGDWHPQVTVVEMTDDTTRVISIEGQQGTITESLDESDAERRYISFRLLREDITVIPVSFYSIAIQLEAVDAGTEVTWRGRFYRGDTGNFPPENLSDAAAVEAMTAYARNGLEGLQQSLAK
ncbi:MxaD protein [Methylophaga lonarensis MPL]|uniref:MxaD protein n=1 Tax=Methylophaga lonarensis MPL TaxID=1286106 RepID=M7PPM7_9GAMM|nr:SRPBCC family protein [Methylophaga lonarensis]EMR12414.1 MxaD protein [Methylophaga lonarensis MPL]